MLAHRTRTSSRFYISGASRYQAVAQALAYDLEGEDRARFVRYEAARSLQAELREGADRGQSAEELARQYGLLAEDVSMVLYAVRARCTARV